MQRMLVSFLTVFSTIAGPSLAHGEDWEGVDAGLRRKSLAPASADFHVLIESEDSLKSKCEECSGEGHYSELSSIFKSGPSVGQIANSSGDTGQPPASRCQGPERGATEEFTSPQQKTLQNEPVEVTITPKGYETPRENSRSLIKYVKYEPVEDATTQAASSEYSQKNGVSRSTPSEATIQPSSPGVTSQPNGYQQPCPAAAKPSPVTTQPGEAEKSLQRTPSAIQPSPSGVTSQPQGSRQPSSTTSKMIQPTPPRAITQPSESGQAQQRAPNAIQPSSAGVSSQPNGYQQPCPAAAKPSPVTTQPGEAEKSLQRTPSAIQPSPSGVTGQLQQGSQQPSSTAPQMIQPTLPRAITQPIESGETQQRMPAGAQSNPSDTTGQPKEYRQRPQKVPVMIQPAPIERATQPIECDRHPQTAPRSVPCLPMEVVKEPKEFEQPLPKTMRVIKVEPGAVPCQPCTPMVVPNACIEVIPCEPCRNESVVCDQPLPTPSEAVCCSAPCYNPCCQRWFVEVEGGWYRPQSHRFRSIYGSAGMVGIEGSYRAWCGFHIFGSFNYIFASGQSICNPPRYGTDIYFLPLTLGIKWMGCYCLSKFVTKPYLGLGGVATYLHIHDKSPFVHRISTAWAGGGIVKVGSLIYPPCCKRLFIDLFVDYTFYGDTHVRYSSSPSVIRHSANLSGLGLGIGVGYSW